MFMPKDRRITVNINRLIAHVTAAVVLIHCVGCTHTIKVTYKYGPPGDATLPCPVSLSMSKEYCEYHHLTPSVFMVHDSFAVPYGPALREYAIYVAQSVFGDVQVLADNTPVRNESRILLKPKVISSSLEPPMGSPATGALGVQWIFADTKTGQILFGMPIQCEYTAKGGLFGPSLSVVPAGLMEELGGTTIKRFSSSTEIQRLSGH
jgi:hypothetical protein